MQARLTIFRGLKELTMRILVAAAPVLLAWACALPAHALDDTPTQTPYLSSKVDDSRASPPVVMPRQSAARRTELDDLRRPLRAAIVPPAAPPVPLPPAAQARAQPAASRTPALADRSIGLR
jgi:hypothetical protein